MESKTQNQLPSMRTIFFFIIIQIIVGFCVFSCVRMFNNASINICPDTQNKLATPAEVLEDKLLILLWTWPHGQRFPLDECPGSLGISGCSFTVNHSLYGQAGAVVLHHRDVCGSKQQLPQIPRPTNQQWVWFNLESPTYSPNLGFMDNLINLTMSYRVDSDIFSPYGWLETLEEPQNFSIPAKSKLVAWAVSHWNPGHKRVKYYQELQKHIQIDMFGHGGHILVRNSNKMHSIISQYKFYLAFENSQHQDYITEKLWNNALLSGAVPVVLGATRESYERFLPADAFIHIDDFPSAQELAAYLKLLDSDDKKYQRYFEWRTRFRIMGEIDWIFHYCKACRFLRQNPNYRSTRSITNWYK